MKPIIIIESGSSKADWVLVKDHILSKHSTQGLNPALRQDFSTILDSEVTKQLIKQSEAIYFYGAGISDDGTKNIVINNFKAYTNQQIEVYSDLMAAARSCLKGKEGIVGILGTGSNACYYNGSQLFTPIPSLGYLFADEGSGNHIGKEVIKSYFYGDMPRPLHVDFEEKYRINRFDMIKAVYHDHLGSAYLASYAEWLKGRSDAWSQNLIERCFLAFLENWIMRIKDYQRYDLHFVGSIAYFFQDILKQCFEKNNLSIKSITQRPMEGLIEYHKSI
jgi:N-acetylglucosamine kinase-like BadF-type ATPase